MRLSTRGRYGVRAMLDIALCKSNGPVNLRKMASRQDISADYLEQLLRKLRKAGLVASTCGPHGGFRLAKDPKDILVWDIVLALEDPIAPVACVDAVMGKSPDEGPCQRMSTCATHFLWEGLARTIRKFLESKTLQDLLDDAQRLFREAGNNGPMTYSI